MTLQQLIRILKARMRLVLATMFIVVVAAIAAMLLLPPRYSAATTLVVNVKGIDPITGGALPADLMPSYMATQVDVIQSYAVARNRNRFVSKNLQHY